MRALFEPLRLQQAAHAGEFLQAVLQLLLDALHRLLQGRARRHVVRVGVDLHEGEVVGLLAGERIELDDRLDLVAEQADAPGAVFLVGREEFDEVAAHAEGAAREIALVALVLQGHQIGDELALLDPLADLHRERHRRIGLDRADTVDAGDRGDDDDVVALEQRARRRVAHAVDLLVDRAFLLDIGVRARHVGLGLVVVVVGDEVFDRVVGEEALELAVELRRQRLVGREDQGRALRLLDDLRHGEGLARAGDAEQHLVALLPAHAVHQFGDGGRLVARGLEIRHQLEADAAFRLVGPRRAVRRPQLAVLEARIALREKARERIHRGGHAVDVEGTVLAEFGGKVRPVIGPAQAELLRQRRVHIGGLAVDVGFLRPLGKTLRRLALPVDRGAEQIREVGVEGFQLRFGRLPGGKLGLLGCLGHRTNMVQRGRIGKCRAGTGRAQKRWRPSAIGRTACDRWISPATEPCRPRG